MKEIVFKEDALKLTKTEALAELEILSKDVEFETEYDSETPVAKLRALVQEGRDALSGKKSDDSSGGDASESRIKREEEPESPPTGAKPARKGGEDYLRQYQYRQNAPFGSKASDPQPGGKAENMKKSLLLQPRVRMIIPRRDGETKGIPYSVTLNGYRLDLPKNVYIELPEQVAMHISECIGQTEAAFERIERDHGIDREKDGAKVSAVLA